MADNRQQPDSPGPWTIRKTVGTPREERPLQTLERLWRQHRALGFPFTYPLRMCGKRSVALDQRLGRTSTHALL